MIICRESFTDDDICPIELTTTNLYFGQFHCRVLLIVTPVVFMDKILIQKRKSMLNEMNSPIERHSHDEKDVRKDLELNLFFERISVDLIVQLE